MAKYKSGYTSRGDGVFTESSGSDEPDGSDVENLHKPAGSQKKNEKQGNVEDKENLDGNMKVVFKFLDYDSAVEKGYKFTNTLIHVPKNR